MVSFSLTGPPPPPGPPPPTPKPVEAPPMDCFNKKKPQSLDDILAKRREQNTTKPKEPIYIDWKVNSASSGTETVRIVVVSDSHNNHDLLNMPPGDILVHCGDMTDVGAGRELAPFNNWLGRQNYAHKMYEYLLSLTKIVLFVEITKVTDYQQKMSTTSNENSPTRLIYTIAVSQLWESNSMALHGFQTWVQKKKTCCTMTTRSFSVHQDS